VNGGDAGAEQRKHRGCSDEAPSAKAEAIDQRPPSREKGREKVAEERMSFSPPAHGSW